MKKNVKAIKEFLLEIISIGIRKNEIAFLTRRLQLETILL